MKLRHATPQDIPHITQMYQDIIKDMNTNGYMFWTQEYPLIDIINDIHDHKVYIMLKDQTILFCFTLNQNNPGNNHVTWLDNTASYFYLDRLGVNIHYKRQGLASLTLNEAQRIAKEHHKDYLRLFVATANIPALKLYESNGFTIAKGTFYDTVNGIYLEELGLEIKT